jgi:hypothetical protein
MPSKGVDFMLKITIHLLVLYTYKNEQNKSHLIVLLTLVKYYIKEKYHLNSVLCLKNKHKRTQKTGK